MWKYLLLIFEWTACLVAAGMFLLVLLFNLRQPKQSEGEANEKLPSEQS